MNVGYIGLGARGAAFAQRLSRSHKTVVYDACAARAQQLNESNATVASDLHSLASASNVILLSLADQSQVEATLFGSDGLEHALVRGTVIVDQTPGDPARTRAFATRLAAHGSVLVDAPTSAEPDEITAGTACLMYGGPDTVFREIKPILASLSDNIVNCGATGDGHAAALVSHAVTLCNRLITYEGAAVAVKYGLALDVTSSVINKSGAWNGASERVLPILGAGGDVSGQPLTQALKDMHTVVRTAIGCGVPMFIASTVYGLIETACNDISPETPVDELARLFELMADIRFAGS